MRKSYERQDNHTEKRLTNGSQDLHGRCETQKAHARTRLFNNSTFILLIGADSMGSVRKAQVIFVLLHLVGACTAPAGLTRLVQSSWIP